MLDTHCEKRLRIEGLNAFYGDSHVLHGIDLHVERGELVTLLGRNGAGKTTTLRAIMGLVERRGDIRFDGADLSRLPPHKIARFGIGYVPEERGIFSSLDVTENLLLPPTIKPGGMTIEEIYTLFPNLKERAGSQGTKLSGGEQQMLAMARILRTGADFLLLDEVTEGLAPVIIEQIGIAIGLLKERGFTILLVEQNFPFASRIADRHYVVENGRVVDMVAKDDLNDPGVAERLHSFLGV
ncbi:branched-chain amino acid transport system ATP-binding protein [Rhizobium petrolearium]|jgi:branched-chain amino acid transport system ATP-binding protein|uniref:ABC transporter ATP-binding protein n=2 Tax=Neorhizobium TaxID=1525371 RepID=A0ABV0MA06_9HYPH|nr:ABC transporter ATP-binding protein [Neorhizobium petrolearium]MBP1847236.1 branched-chain amino acid transport system ATP-binding protein [Neorhizobium petrolearium]MCC2614283.1 ABC transporter ATP-binding protein [Neorhizobium petrolearium]WGI72387.1 ABC transporter ATP-binding protein [Neorhizobium petrolearium]